MQSWWGHQRPMARTSTRGAGATKPAHYGAQSDRSATKRRVAHSPGGHRRIQQPRIGDPAVLLSLLQRDEVPQAAGEVRDNEGPEDGAEEAGEGGREVEEGLQLRDVGLDARRPAS